MKEVEDQVAKLYLFCIRLEYIEHVPDVNSQKKV